MDQPNRPSRRVFLESLAAGLVPVVVGGQAFAQDHGRIKPAIPTPDIMVMRHDGISTSLSALVSHHATALQLMFTSCTTTCPIQGAIFARVQTLIPDQTARGIQLVSLSVDAKRDTPEALSKWLQRFHARPGWIAAAPRFEDTERLRAFGGGGKSPTDNHSTQVHILNREGLLVWRTLDLPGAEDVAEILCKL